MDPTLINTIATFVGIAVGIIGIIVGIIGFKSLNEALKIRNTANKNKDSSIQQAHTINNHGLKPVDVVDLAERTAKNEVEKIPYITEEIVDGMVKASYIHFIKPEDWIKEKDSMSRIIKAEQHGRGKHPVVGVYIVRPDGSFDECGCAVSANETGDVTIGITAMSGVDFTLRIIIK
jgi:hypothetical protein